MDNYKEDRLESVDMQSSQHVERTLLQLGAVLYNSLVAAERLDEVEILFDVIADYSTMTSYYGDKTQRLTESLGVDLNEAALFKRDALARNSSNEWQIYANQFAKNLISTAEDLGIDPPSLR